MSFGCSSRPPPRPPRDQFLKAVAADPNAHFHDEFLSTDSSSTFPQPFAHGDHVFHMIDAEAAAQIRSNTATAQQLLRNLSCACGNDPSAGGVFRISDFRVVACVSKPSFSTARDHNWLKA